MATVVGESIRISGHLGGDEDLTVRGRVEGKVDLTRTLIVEPSGVVKAEVSVRNALVSGVVVGNINASDSVELTADARVVGDLTAPRVIIVDGASFKGRVDMGDLDIARPRTQGAASRPVATSAAGRPTTPERRAPPTPPRPSSERVEAKVVATASTAKRVKAPSAPPKPPPASRRKKKVKVKKRR